MATLHPFRALRPRPAEAARIAAVPYDVVSTDEARALAADGAAQLSARLARRDRSAGRRPIRTRDAVYERAAENFETLKRTALVLEEQPSVYFYRLRMGEHEQTGIAACFSLDEYDRDVIKKHERTRRDKEDDRTRHMLALGAQTGSGVPDLSRARRLSTQIATRVDRRRAALRLHAPDGVRHTLWRAGARRSRRARRRVRAESRRCTSPTAITAPRAPRARAPTFATAPSRAPRSATAPTTRRFSPSRSRTTRCRCSPTTAS